MWELVAAPNGAGCNRDSGPAPQSARQPITHAVAVQVLQMAEQVNRGDAVGQDDSTRPVLSRAITLTSRHVGTRWRLSG